MNWLVNWGIKKYALNFINSVLEAGATSVQKALAITDKAIAKAEAVLAFLKSLRAKLADNKITDEETDALVADVKALVAEITA